MVEATYTGPVAESYPTQGVAGRIVILQGERTDDPDGAGPSVLPNTGGAPPVGVVLIGGALLVLGSARFLR
jgi:LPXTG-motif cell wall-anchored protein